MADDTSRDEAASQQEPRREPEIKRRWVGPALLTLLVVTPVGILIFSNLSTETVTWLGFELTAPLWLILIITFAAGMIGGKVFGWTWRKYRQRSRRLKEELAVLRKHSAEAE